MNHKPAQPSTEGAPHSTLPTVYFDGGCPVCSREVAVYQRERGGQDIRWEDVTRCEPVELGPGLSREAALARLHLRRSDGELVSGAAAFTGMWMQLPRWTMAL
jgi:predicted DCC family thiol-disulfide oxidoreductase YuxK